MPAQFPSPTVYAALMDRALAKPLPDWNEGVEMHLRGLSDALIRYGEEMLREVYVAGVRDGFVQGVEAAEERIAERFRNPPEVDGTIPVQHATHSSPWSCPKCGKAGVACGAVEPAACVNWRESSRA